MAERAEEWRVFVTKAGQVLRVEHTLPEAPAWRGARRGHGAHSRGRRPGAGLRPRCGERAGARSLRASRKTESTDRLDIHIRGHVASALAAGRASNNRRDRRRRSGRRPAVRVRARGVGAAAARCRGAQPDRADCHRGRLRRPPRVGCRPGRGRVEPKAVHAAALLRRGRDHARRDGRVSGQRVAIDSGADEDRATASSPNPGRDRCGPGRAHHHVEPGGPGTRGPAGSLGRVGQPRRARRPAARRCGRRVRRGAAGAGRVAPDAGLGGRRGHRTARSVRAGALGRPRTAWQAF